MPVTTKKLSISVIVIVLLLICLTVTSIALAYAVARLEDNIFETGTVDINLNDQKPVFNLNSIEPGATYEETFWLKNDSTTSVFYKIYCNNFSGKLSEALIVKLYRLSLDESGKETDRTIVYTGSMINFVKDKSPKSDTALGVGETQFFAMQIYMPIETGNSMQSLSLTFDIEAMAVQAKNNPNGEFN